MTSRATDNTYSGACPSGCSEVTQSSCAAACQSAMGLSSTPSLVSGSWGWSPKGCYYYGGRAEFNSHSSPTSDGNTKTVICSGSCTDSSSSSTSSSTSYVAMTS